jgi:putative tryptophan/tyrosine transport system substrate-binding protein
MHDALGAGMGRQMPDNRPRLSRRRLVQGAGVAGLGLLAACGRLAGPAPPSRIRHVGYLGGGFPGEPSEVAFLEGLRELGYVEGQTLTLERRFAEGRAERLPQLVAELVAVPVDVILTSGPSATVAAKRDGTTLPIVMCYGGEPIEQGLIASLARPSGNVTGFAALTSELGAKRLELLVEALPGLSRIAVLWDASAGLTDRARLDSAARALTLELQSVDIRGPDDIDAAFDTASAGRPEALFLGWDPLSMFNALRQRIADRATQSRLPWSGGSKDFAEVGALISYGAHFPDMYRRAASHVDKILKGAKPADLPVEQPTRFDFVINLQTARVLGLTIPQHVLLQATELIQ